MRTNEPEPELADGLVAEAVESIELAGESKTAKKAIKAERKAEKKAAKREKKATTKAAKAAAKEARAAAQAGGRAPEIEPPAAKENDVPRITPKQARNAISVSKVVLPVVIPVVAPYAVRAVNAAREAYDKARARRLGVDVDSVGEYAGRGAGLHVRIAGLSDGLRDLRDGGEPEAVKFADQTAATLRQLSSAVRAAERMPGARRKEAHRAVGKELDELEAQLLHHLGV